MKAHYSISDLHLSADEPELTALFFDFLKEHGSQMHSLDILGDFFDAWIGDDDDCTFVQTVALQLKQISEKFPVRFAHGNRDFLLGHTFAQQTGITLLDEISVEHNWIICHGDHLCTDDLAYMQFRQQVRNPAWQQVFLSQPLETRRQFAANARAQSKAHQQNAAMAIMDVNTGALDQLMQAHPNHVLLHGHTHRPGVFKQQFGTRIVLGDWRINQPSYLRCTDQEFILFAHGQRWQGELN